MENSMKYIQSVLEKILFLICFAGLIFQTSDLIQGYLGGKTSVSLNVVRIQLDLLPAITICTKNILAIGRVVKYDPDFQSLYNEYEQLYYDLYNLTKVKGAAENETELVKQIEAIFRNITKSLDFINIPALEIHDNISVPMIPSEPPFAYFRVYIVGQLPLNGSVIEVNSFRNNSFLEQHQSFPIESLKAQYQGDDFDPQKCWTSFSQLNTFWRNFRFKLDWMEIHLLPKLNWMPVQMFKEISFSIHSPNTLPDFGPENFNLLSTSKVHEILYSQVQTELLGEGYDTNCYNYDLDYKYANSNMRSDCITDCFQKTVRKRCNFTDFAPFTQLWRKDLLRANSHFRIEKSFCGYPWKTRTDCFNECRPDCKFKYFLWSRTERNRTADWEKPLLIEIRHSPFPDVTIKYSPQISFLSFVCNFGGLLGIWLGLSIVAIFNRVLLFILNAFIKRDIYLGKLKSVKNDININFHANFNVKNPVIRPKKRKNNSNTNLGRFAQNFYLNAEEF